MTVATVFKISVLILKAYVIVAIPLLLLGLLTGQTHESILKGVSASSVLAIGFGGTLGIYKTAKDGTLTNWVYGSLLGAILLSGIFFLSRLMVDLIGSQHPDGPIMYQYSGDTFRVAIVVCVNSGLNALRGIIPGGICGGLVALFGLHRRETSGDP